MTEAIDNQSAGWRMKVAIFALCIAIFAVLWFMTAALGTKFGLWSWQVGLGQMTFIYGPIIAFAAVISALVAQIVALIKAPRKQPFIIALAATLIAAMLLFRLMGMGAQAAALPPIHDIQTDWSDPIQFSETVMTVRATDGAINAVEDAPVIDLPAPALQERWPGMHQRLVSEVQEEAETTEASKDMVYPTLQPLYFDDAPQELASLAENLMADRGWEIVTATPETGDIGDSIQIEATATSGWFGFKDDVAVRIRTEAGITRVDMRSTSRVGLSDLGANAKRVYGLMMELQDKADGRANP